MPQDVSFALDKTFTAASSVGVVADNTTSSQVVSMAHGEGPSGDMSMGHQALFTTAFFDSTGSAGLASIVAKITVPDGAAGTETVIYEEAGTVTVTAKRTNVDGANGGYLATVVWAGTGLKTFDCGMVGAVGKGAKLYVICTAISGAVSLRVLMASTRNAG